MTRKEQKKSRPNRLLLGDFGCLTPLSTLFQLTHDHQSQLWKKPEYPEIATDHGQTTGKFYQFAAVSRMHHYCNLQSRVRTHTVLVISWYELLGNPTTQIIEPNIQSGSMVSFMRSSSTIVLIVLQSIYMNQIKEMFYQDLYQLTPNCTELVLKIT